MKYFTNCKTLDELKAEYRRLAMANHPDRGGGKHQRTGHQRRQRQHDR